MRSQDSRGSGQRGRGRGRRSGRSNRDESRAPQPPPKLSFWQKLIGFFKSKPAQQQRSSGSRPKFEGVSASNTRSERTERQPRPVRKPEAVEVTTPKLYIGNLSYDATEGDLSELFNGIGVVRSTEIVTHRETEKSKGFGFVTMTTVDEAKRAVVELHDKDFMGRKLVVSGAKTPVERDSAA
jgi:RNA recognition motif-containing protein